MARQEPLGRQSHQICVIDSHTGGEPTRVVIDGGPQLCGDTVKQMATDFTVNHDYMRRAIAGEPRGHDVIVGALLCDSPNKDCDAGVIFFNNVGVLGMCGHGMIGVVETLRYLGRISGENVRIDTPVGVVVATIGEDDVTIENVPSYRIAADVTIEVPGLGAVSGDVAWGGNWFYLVRQPVMKIRYVSVSQLQLIASEIRSAINHRGFPQVDHVELFGLPDGEGPDSKNFVLCPGLEYDRSPCGTGTSAKVACLAADKALEPGQVWTQQGILGTCFQAWYEWADDTTPCPEGSTRAVVPKIRATAYITLDGKLMFDDRDPFKGGIDVE